jgi:hypothetical protein
MFHVGKNCVRRDRDVWNVRSRAESLIETLIAITVIVIVSTSAMILIRTSMVGNQVIGEKVIALNLALEGIEAVKNIRDTNYLKLASDPDNCWRVIDVDDPADCNVDNWIKGFPHTGTIYSLRRDVAGFFSTVFSWGLVEVADEDTDGFLSSYTYELNNGDLVPMYFQSGIPIGHGHLMGFTLVEEDVFQRLLTFDYDGDLDSFDVTVTVNWTVDEVEKTLSLTRTIANVY